MTEELAYYPDQLAKLECKKMIKIVEFTLVIVLASRTAWIVTVG